MEQVLTVTILDYFRKIHKQEIENSNAISLLNKLKEFEQIHSGYKIDYKGFRGLSFESILEVIQQDIHRLQQSHNLYISTGNLITPHTKQRNIERKNREYNTDNIQIPEHVLVGIRDKVKQGVKEALMPQQKDNSKDFILSSLEYKNNKKLFNKK